MSQAKTEREQIKGYSILEELAYDLIWSWDHRADSVWEELDRELWALTKNPLVVLQTVSTERLKTVLANPEFCRIIHDLKEADEKLHTEKSSWFHKNHPEGAAAVIAYFSMEFMLSEALPIYSGGLGNVAGDQLKSVNDLGVPVVGIGLLYQQGYFRQVINREGEQQALYPYNSPEQLPIKPVRLPNGEWLRIELALPGWKLWLRAWEVKIGRVKLYLLDSNDAANYPPHRTITSELYGGDIEVRLKQELVLGIGGWRLLEALGTKPNVCHLNEGHAAFAILERAKSFRKETGCSFEIALTATRAGNLFTNHTAVPAGFDRFPPFLIEQYLGAYAKEHLDLSIQEVLSLGRQNPEDSNEPFNMAYLAIRGSGAVNGVSRLHGEVSREIFTSLFPRWPVAEVPVGYVTNGVHISSWDSNAADTLWADSCGKGRWFETAEDLEKKFRLVPDAKIWEMRNSARKSMVEFGRAQLTRLLAARGALPEDVWRAKSQFNSNILTLGFARRFATYKRPNMLLHDPERLLRILTNQERPVQLVLAGKAHPADKGGQALIKQWMEFMWRPEARPHVIFVSDYDMSITERLVGGVDVWINTPRRPWEACGTSGMKVLVNGGLNLSELDGWWAEAYTPQVGWALGDGKTHGDDPAWDAEEANQLYDLLENHVIPEFYNRNKEGIPTAWVAKVKESMARLTPRFSSNRAVRDYTEKYYLPAFKNFQKRAGNQAKWAKEIADWKRSIREHFLSVRFGEIKAETQGKEHAFEVQCSFGLLDPNAVKVELFATGLAPIEMRQIKRLEDGSYRYGAKAAATTPIKNFTARARAYFPEIDSVLESPEILWQR